MELMRVSPKSRAGRAEDAADEVTAVTSSASSRREELLQPQRQMADQAGEPRR
jgi:hypothetical protein